MKVKKHPKISDAMGVKILSGIGIVLAVMLFILVFKGLSGFFLNLLNKLFLIPTILISLTIHEYAHAKVADFLGDNTPRRMGRLTLNPLKHLDFYGTLMLLFLNFGWAKPVEVNSSNFKDPDKAMVAVALAGPISNMILAFLGMFSLKLLDLSSYFVQTGSYSILLALFPLAIQTLKLFVFINLGLALFNLIPIPPLDGSRLTSYFVPLRYKYQYSEIEAKAPIILLLFMFIGGFDRILTPMVNSSYIFLLSIFF